MFVTSHKIMFVTSHKIMFMTSHKIMFMTSHKIMFMTMSEKPIDDIELEEADPVDGSFLDVSLVEEVNSNSQELLLRCL